MIFAAESNHSKHFIQKYMKRTTEDEKKATLKYPREESATVEKNQKQTWMKHPSRKFQMAMKA